MYLNDDESRALGCQITGVIFCLFVIISTGWNPISIFLGVLGVVLFLMAMYEIYDNISYSSQKMFKIICEIIGLVFCLIVVIIKGFNVIGILCGILGIVLFTMTIYQIYKEISAYVISDKIYKKRRMYPMLSKVLPYMHSDVLEMEDQTLFKIEHEIGTIYGDLNNLVELKHNQEDFSSYYRERCTSLKCWGYYKYNININREYKKALQELLNKLSGCKEFHYSQINSYKDVQPYFYQRDFYRCGYKDVQPYFYQRDFYRRDFTRKTIQNDEERLLNRLLKNNWDIFDKEFIVWQSFRANYCAAQDLDYTYDRDSKTNFENIKNYENGLIHYNNSVYQEIAYFIKSLNKNIFVVVKGNWENRIGASAAIEKFRIFGLTDIIDWKDMNCINCENVIIIDSVTSYNDLKDNILDLTKHCEGKKPCIAYISLMKEYSRKEMNEIIESRKAEAEKKRKEEEEKRQIRQDINTLNESVKQGQIETAQEKVKTLRKTVEEKQVDQELVDLIDKAETNFNNRYKEGINDSTVESQTSLLRVDYDAPSKFVQGEDWKYAVAKFPKKGNIVFPHRRQAIARRGYNEYNFQCYLQEALGKDLEFIGDCSLLPAEGYRPYEPDIAIIVRSHTSIRIDIEIDEPYAGIKQEPIHYIGCGDDFRDMNLNNLGWIVVRFTEYQTFTMKESCAAYIACLINSIFPQYIIPTSLRNVTFPKESKRWTEIEAFVMMSHKYRETYLNHQFSGSEDERLKYEDIKQTNIEKSCAKEIRPLVVATNKKNQLEFASIKTGRDTDIQFFPEEHVYLYKGKIRFHAVSDIIDCYFMPFNTDYWSNYKAYQWHVPQGQVMEEWDMKGEQSKQVGTFMHKQIENYYKGLDYIDEYHFVYNGSYVHSDTIVSLETEYYAFRQFVEDHPFKPYRTEWAIYDESLGIAGTIDMIHKHDGVYDIYDWKRSHRIYQNDKNSYGQKSMYNLRDVEDTPYWHYCIQQNLYKYILEHNYSIIVDKMYLVVFQESHGDYQKMEVPDMTEKIEAIIDDCRTKEILDRIKY